VYSGSLDGLAGSSAESWPQISQTPTIAALKINAVCMMFNA
jgi:hypothetical protein